MAQGERIRVLVACDDPVARNAICKSLSDSVEFEIIGAASTLDEARRLASEAAPSVVLAGKALLSPGPSAASAQAGEARPMLIFIERPPEPLALKADAADGALDLRPEDIAGFACRLRRMIGEPRPLGERGPHDDLTPREFDILLEIAGGASNRAIAEKLGLTEGTVKGYVSVVLSKLGVSNRKQARAYAKARGLDR